MAKLATSGLGERRCRWSGSAGIGVRTALLLATLLICGISFPGAVEAQHAGAYSQLGFGARGMAVGNAQVADISGKSSAFYNPALAPYTRSQALTGSIASMAFDREMQFLEFATPIHPAGGITAGVVYAGVTDIDGRDESGYHTGTLSSAEHGLFVAFGTRFGDRISAGTSITFYRARIAEADAQARGIAIDLGVTYRITEELALGLAATDLLASYDWETVDDFGGTDRLRTDHFPMRFRGGLSYMWTANIQVLSEIEVRRARIHDPAQGHAHALHGELRLGVSHQPMDGLWLHGGIDRVARWAISRPAAGFSLELPIGQLELEAEYSAVYEQPVQALAHVLALSVDL